MKPNEINQPPHTTQTQIYDKKDSKWGDFMEQESRELVGVALLRNHRTYCPPCIGVLNILDSRRRIRAL